MGHRHELDEDDDAVSSGSGSSSTAGSRVIAIGTAVGCGAFAALLGSMPAALRLQDVDGERRGWLLLAACAVPFTTLAVIIFREAYVGLRAYSGSARNFVRVFASLWLGSSAVILFGLGRVLRATTHHHALAGATFALAGAVVLVACGLFTHRIARAIESLRTREPAHVRAHALLSTLAYGIVVVTVLAAARGLHTKLPTGSAATMVDVTALALASALAARADLRAFRMFAALGPVAAIVLIALGITGFSPDLGALVNLRAPAYGALLELLGRPS